MRYALLFALFAGVGLLSGCDASSNSGSSSQGVISNLGQTVLDHQTQMADAGEGVKSALTSLGTATTNAVDPVKDSLTSLGETVQSGTETVSGALEAVGQTVIDATGGDTGTAGQQNAQ